MSVSAAQSTTSSGTSRPRGDTFLPIAAACAFLVGLDSLVVSPLAPAITQSTGTQIGVGGLLVTAYALAYAIGGPLFGPVSDRYGRKPLVLTGLAVFAAGTALTGVGSSFGLVLAFRALAGIGAAMIMPSLFAGIADTRPPQQIGSAIGKVMGSLMAASVLGVPFGAFVAGLSSWRLAFWGIAGLAVVAGVVVAVGLPSAPPPRRIPVGPLAAYVGQFKAAFASSAIVFLLLAAALSWAATQTMFANVGIFYARYHELSTTQIGLVILLAGLATVSGNLAAGRLSQRVGTTTLITAAAVVSAVTVLVLSTLTSALWPAILVQLVWAFAFGLAQALMTTLAGELSPQARGTALSLNASSQYLGMMAGTAAAAALVAASDTFLPVGVFCAVCAVLVVPAVVLFERRARASAGA